VASLPLSASMWPPAGTAAVTSYWAIVESFEISPAFHPPSSSSPAPSLLSYHHSTHPSLKICPLSLLFHIGVPGGSQRVDTAQCSVTRDLDVIHWAGGRVKIWDEPTPVGLLPAP
jgi:hypothetical protein